MAGVVDLVELPDRGVQLRPQHVDVLHIGQQVRVACEQPDRHSDVAQLPDRRRGLVVVQHVLLV